MSTTMTLAEAWADEVATEQGWVEVTGFDRPVFVHRTNVTRPWKTPTLSEALRRTVDASYRRSEGQWKDFLVAVPVRYIGSRGPDAGPNFPKQGLWEAVQAIVKDECHLVATYRNPIPLAGPEGSRHAGYEGFRFDAEETWVFQCLSSRERLRGWLHANVPDGGSYEGEFEARVPADLVGDRCGADLAEAMQTLAKEVGLARLTWGVQTRWENQEERSGAKMLYLTGRPREVVPS